SVVAGYATMFLVVFLGLSLVWVVLGADGAFQPGTFSVSTTWILLSIVVGFLAAMAGGWVSRRIAITDAGPKALALVVVVLGVLLASHTFAADATDAPVRTGTLPMFGAISAARTPAWVALLMPVLGAVGVVVGGRKGHARSLAGERSESDMLRACEGASAPC